MKYEWDEAKRRSNIARHGLDFIDVAVLFAGPTVQAPARSSEGEHRWLAIGLIDGVAATVILTRRGRAVRIISLRRARHGERAEHQKLFSR